ncbi:MAG: TatD family hydrolase, partial [Anaerolineaceae bacterium]|nr:TatD family hydrolase [Anaerolineaceae bacterium]
MEFVDSHCHLNFHSYEQDIHAVLDRAAESGVNHIVVPGLDLKTSREALELATRFEPVYAAIGV